MEGLIRYATGPSDFVLPLDAQTRQWGLKPGVFANRFSAPAENIWTLYNGNGRDVRTPVLSVKHAPGAVYEDAWSGSKLTPRIVAGRAELAVELGPKGVGCVVQRLPQSK